uniref:Uncharacterized protein n=1 Tax=Sphaerodactylus townsendi TaxID=933632 RepID=A0ACB8FXF6_9SAUR
MAARQSPEPSMCRHRPASELTQDISPFCCASMFKNMYTSEVIGRGHSEKLDKVSIKRPLRIMKGLCGRTAEGKE